MDPRALHCTLSWGRCCYLHFTDEEAEKKKSRLTCHPGAMFKSSPLSCFLSPMCPVGSLTLHWVLFSLPTKDNDEHISAYSTCASISCCISYLSCPGALCVCNHYRRILWLVLRSLPHKRPKYLFWVIMLGQTQTCSHSPYFFKNWPFNSDLVYLVYKCFNVISVWFQEAQTLFLYTVGFLCISWQCRAGWVRVRYMLRAPVT